MVQLAQSLVSTFLRKNSAFTLFARHHRWDRKKKIVGSFKNEKEYMKSHASSKESTKKLNQLRITKKQILENEEFDFYNGIPKDILSLKFQKPNPAKVGSFSKMMLNMKSKAYRERHSSCMLEGKFLISDAMHSGTFVRLLYFSRLQNLVGLPVDILRKTNLVKVSFAEIQDASEVEHQSDGLIAVASKQDDVTRKKLIKWREEYLEKNNEVALPVTLICDNIRDAGNMGCLIRTAAAVGCEQILTTKGSVDIWDSKVIRAGAGAHFKIPITPGLSWDEIKDHMEDFDIQDVYLSHPHSRTLKFSDILPRYGEKNAFHKNITSHSELSPENFEDNRDLLELAHDVTMHSLPYYDITFAETGHTVIVLGGEVDGTSAEAFKYSVENYLGNNPTSKNLYNVVNIPMSFGSESLNTATAGGILLYEARRQII